MDVARWEQIQMVFHEAADQPEPVRQDFLEAACGHDRELMADVVAMLKADIRGSSLLDRGLPEVAFQMVGMSPEPAASREFGPYRLKRILGQGGMGVVWLAERKDARNQVAIKFLMHAGLSPARRERFAREIKTLAKLKHPFIARLYDAGALPDGAPWFVMEHVEGVPFTEYCRAPGRKIEEQLTLLRKVCDAVQYAHGQEIIHRDLKPSNILVEKDGTPRLLDFGIARQLQNNGEPDEQTRPGLRFMSPDYGAPEWIRDGSVGFYTDVYALGVMLYEVLAGRLPFDSSSNKFEDDPEKPSELAGGDSARGKAEWGDLDVMCLKALHRDPLRRYPSAEALIRDIDHYLKSEPLEARADSVSYRMAKFVKRNPRAVAAAALVSMLFAISGVFFMRARDRADRDRALATAMNQFLADDLLGRTDPFNGGSAKESFADVVKNASPHIDVKFKSEPLVAARLHQVLARAFDRRSDFPQARREYDRADDLYKQAGGAQSQDAIVVRLQLAAMEAACQEAGSMDRAKALLRDAEISISKITSPRPDLHVWLLSTRGSIAIVENDASSAEKDFSEALTQAQEIPSFDVAARMNQQRLLAFCYLRLGQGAKAGSIFRDLVEGYSKIAGKDSADALRAGMNFSQALLDEGEYAEAIKEQDLIYAPLVARLGEDNQNVLNLLQARAVAKGSLGMWDAAIRDDLKAYNLAVRRPGPVSFFSVAALSDAAVSQCMAGRYSDGEKDARKAFLESANTFGAHAGQTGGVAYALAVCLIGLGKLKEASGLLGNIDVSAVSQLTGNSAVGASVALAQGEIAAKLGDYDLARSYERVAAPVFDRPKMDVGSKQQLARLRTLIASHSR